MGSTDVEPVLVPFNSIYFAYTRMGTLEPGRDIDQSINDGCIDKACALVDRIPGRNVSHRFQQ
jgi:hypothetical protein